MYIEMDWCILWISKSYLYWCFSGFSVKVTCKETSVFFYNFVHRILLKSIAVAVEKKSHILRRSCPILVEILNVYVAATLVAILSIFVDCRRSFWYVVSLRCSIVQHSRKHESGKDNVTFRHNASCSRGEQKMYSKIVNCILIRSELVFLYIFFFC